MHYGFCLPVKFGSSPASKWPKDGLGSPRPGAAITKEGSRRLLRRLQRPLRFLGLRRLDLGGLPLDQLDEVVDDIGVLQPVVGDAAQIDLVRVVAATGQSDIGLARLARPVDDAADDRQGQRRRDVRETLFQHLDGLYDPELLTRAG